MRRALIVDGSIYADMYGPEDQWRRLAKDVPCDSVHLPSGGKVPDLGRYSHVIVTGSEASIVRPEPWFEAEEEAVRRALDLGLPILGSCFGHQMLARVISGPEHTRSSPTPELGWIEVEITAEDPLFEGLARSVHVFASHFDEVCDLPLPWKVLAQSAGCAVQAMRLGDRPVWGIQAHPEIPPREGRALLEGFLARFPAHAPLISPALAQEPRDDGIAEGIVSRFLAFRG